MFSFFRSLQQRQARITELLGHILKTSASIEKSVLTLHDKISLPPLENSGSILTEFFSASKKKEGAMLDFLQGAKFHNRDRSPRIFRACLKCRWVWLSGEKRPSQCPQCHNLEFDRPYQDAGKAKETIQYKVELANGRLLCDTT